MYVRVFSIQQNLDFFQFCCKHVYCVAFSIREILFYFSQCCLWHACQLKEQSFVQKIQVNEWRVYWPMGLIANRCARFLRRDSVPPPGGARTPLRTPQNTVCHGLFAMSCQFVFKQTLRFSLHVFERLLYFYT